MANRVSLEKEIKEYCILNNINDVPGFITQCMLKGFNIFRYGLSPADNIKRQNGEIKVDVSNRKKSEKKEEKKAEKKIEKPVEKENKTKTIEKEDRPIENIVVKKRKIMIKAED